MDKEPTPQDREDTTSLKERIWRIIFLSDTPAAKGFDIVLLWLIAGSILVVMVESVNSISEKYENLLYVLEWTFTFVFTIEYVIRLWIVRKKLRYVFSFFGIVDLISIIPTYLEIILAGSGHFIVIRILRLLRMFRILKIGPHIDECSNSESD